MKIAIIGYAESKRLAPFDNPEWQIWGMNTKFDYIPRFDLWFDLHSPEKILWSPEYCEFLKNNIDKVLLAGKVLGIDAKIYPKDQIFEYFKKNLTTDLKASEFFTCSVAWMIALAIYKGANEIGLYGINQSANKERDESQRTAVALFTGYALGKGIKITIPKESVLFSKEKLYWYL